MVIVFWSLVIGLNPINAQDATATPMPAPSSPAEAHFQKGMVASDSGNYATAISEFNKAVELNANYPEAYHRLAIIYSRQGQYSQAINNANRAITLNPDYLDAYVTRAV